MYSEQAMEHLSSIGRVVYLQIEPDELLLRLIDLNERGVVLKGGVAMTIEELFDERHPLYERYADYIVNVSGLSIRDAANKVVAALS